MIDIKSEMLLLLDLDGTIIMTGKDLDPELADYLKYFNDANSLLITTARPPQGVQYVFKKYFDFIPTISLNGGGLHLSNWERFNSVITISQESLNELLLILKKYRNVTLNCYSKNNWYTSEINPFVIAEAEVTGTIPKIIIEPISEECIKILLMGDNSDLDYIQKIIIQDMSSQIFPSRSNNNYLEITSSKTNKAFFVKDYLKYFKQIERENITILFAGDSENDIVCAKYADYAWTYTYAPDELKAHCSLLKFENGKGLKSLLKQIIK